MGRTNQNLKMRLLQHHNSISSSLEQNTKPENFTSALSEHIYNYPNHFILFENVSLISRDQRLKQIFRETIEIKTRAKSSYGTCDEVGRAESSYGTRLEEPRAKSSFGTCEKVKT